MQSVGTIRELTLNLNLYRIQTLTLTLILTLTLTVTLTLSQALARTCAHSPLDCIRSVRIHSERLGHGGHIRNR